MPLLAVNCADKAPMACGAVSNFRKSVSFQNFGDLPERAD